MHSSNGQKDLPVDGPQSDGHRQSEGVTETGAETIEPPAAGAQAATPENDDRKLIREYFNRKFDDRLVKDVWRQKLAMAWMIFATPTGLILLGLGLYYWDPSTTRGFWGAVSLMVGGIFLLSTMIYFFFRRGLPSRRELEQRIDGLTENDLKRLKDRAFRLLGVGESGAQRPDPVAFRCFPVADRMPDLFKAGRVGTKGRLRITPCAQALLFFEPDTLVYFEGAVDLTTGEIIYEEMREIFYRDIVEIGRNSALEPIERGHDGAKSLMPKQRSGAKKAGLKESLVISSNSGNKIEIIFRNAGFGGGWNRSKIDSPETAPPIDDIWNRLKAHKRQAFGKAL